ncbi:MAG: hypothetical protein HOP33_02815 [Verrucomicrobia bacterium]|nr:hypothetical protein [Verrucomicrobiota bacterium]
MIWACYIVCFLILTLLAAFLYKLVEERRWRRVLKEWDEAPVQLIDVKPLCSRLQMVRASFAKLDRHGFCGLKTQRHLNARQKLLQRAFFHHEDDASVSTDVK